MSTNDPIPESSPSGYLFHLAWKRLWKKDSPYYLPRVIAEGISKDGHDIPALSPVSIEKIGPLEIVDAPVLGTLSVEMSDNQLAGLGNIKDGGLTYDNSNQTFSAVLKADGTLIFSGNYQIYSSSKFTACAMNAAHSLLGVLNAEADGESDDKNGNNSGDNGNKPSDLDVARDYRGRLIQHDNGRTLVGTYYDNNEAMSIMFESGETPAQNWRTMWTQYTHKGRTTRDLMDQTSKACRNPDSKDHQVGGDDFSDHSLTLQTAMLSNALRMRKSGKYKDDPRFDKLIQDIASFKFAATNHDGKQTANSVMGTVKKDPDNVRQQIERGEVDATPSPKHMERITTFFADRETDVVDEADSDARYKTQAHGTFKDTFQFDEIRISGSVQPQDDSIGVHVKSVALTGGSLTVNLGPPSGGSKSAYDKVAQAIGNAQFVNDLMIKKAGDKMNGSDVRDYLSNRINQSVNKIFGDA